MKPIIGITANYSTNEQIGTNEGIGAKNQEWQILADDYIQAVEKAGGIPLILPITRDPATAARLVPLLDGILFSGGHDLDPQTYGELPRYGLGATDPERDHHELELLRLVIEQTTIPILAICRGCQLLNVAYGGTLYQDLERERAGSLNHAPKHSPKHHPTHPVEIVEGSILHGIYNETGLRVNSFHHQAIKELGENLRVTMTSPDGVLEGIEGLDPQRFIIGVQWHPEMMVHHDASYLPLFRHFIDRCK
ncbi:gamma-glutamyl-gamma-aminobutyrate hydrolase family protein [Ammoniphilus sp. YIM 78166]|uniref:gamma-glutamyl-gamma-aminobutyrate hydrolase family protein n=1 Tax=Ammoniphilus sp. YIM 78166 TaxID=1644106 RepID=UPI00106F703C|nr:gamma-glutamyl-gamma-aminobutyrate hydrolase family protein [Ammoniphilus sp. YIM 78166]